MRVKLQIALLAATWIVIAILQAVGTFLVDDRFFGYREWEFSVVGANTNEAPFRPYAVWDATSHGDLSHMAGVPQLKQCRHQRFTTDEYGFRNPPGTLDRLPDVVILGDSTAVGSQANDDETLCSRIRAGTGLNVYNASGANPSRFLGDTRFVQHPPRQVILMCAERNLNPRSLSFPGVIPPFSPRRWVRHEVRVPMPFQQMRGFADCVDAMNGGRAFRPFAETIYKGFLYACHLYRFPEEIFFYHRETHTFFFSESVQRQVFASSVVGEVNEALRVIRRYADELRRRGISLLVLIVPEKETVYSDLVPALKNRDVDATLRHVAAELDRAGIAEVNLLDVFRRYRAQHPEAVLYYPDDTHLNGLGHRLVFEGVCDKLPPPAPSRSIGF
jgi:hypothetical protein